MSQPLVIAISLLVTVVLAVYFGFVFKKVEDEPAVPVNISSDDDLIQQADQIAPAVLESGE